ncbi:MAG: hypothetical protein AABX47_08190 [Nanoarchaeota archaeon]
MKYMFSALRSSVTRFRSQERAPRRAASDEACFSLRREKALNAEGTDDLSS